MEVKVFDHPSTNQIFAVCDCGWKYGISYFDERSQSNIEHAVTLHKNEHNHPETIPPAIYHRVAVSYTKADKYVGAMIHFNCACGWNVRFRGWNPWQGNGMNGAPVDDVLAHFQEVQYGSRFFANAR